MSEHYWAVRYKTIPGHVRIERASTALRAAELAFGGPILRGSRELMEYKDMGASAAIMRSDRKRIAMLADKNNWLPLEKTR